MRGLVALCLLAGSIVLAPAAETAVEKPAADEPSGQTAEAFIMRVHVTDEAKQIPTLAALQLDLAGIDIKAKTADFVGDWSTFQQLRDAGFTPEIVWTPSQAATAALSDYLDPTEIGTRLDTYQANYPTLAKKVSIATTANGRPEWAMKISDNVAVEEDEPAIFYIGQHHAREVMTPEIAIDIIDYLLTRYATDPQVRAWVDTREIWVVPSHNPDGTNSVFTGTPSWRKNRRNNGDGTFGVDPNRNYPFQWNSCGGSSGVTSNDTYHGPSGGSEPETQGYMLLARDQQPVMSLSYHTYSELVIHPYGCSGTTNPDTRLFRDVTSDMAVRMRNDANTGWYSNGTPWELLYPVDGDSDAWLYGELGTIATTIEANSATQGFQPDYATWRNQTVLRNRPGWQYLLDRIDGSSIWGHVTDACTGAPLKATIGIDEIVLANGETPRSSEVGFGRYHRLTEPGTWTLRSAKAGYGTQVWPTAVGDKAVRREVRLAPSGAFAVEYFSNGIVDAAGDGDTQVDPGESITMPVTAYATGGAVSGVTGTLSTSDPYVAITDSTAAWPAIGAGATAASSDPFAFTVSPTAPDGHVITFTLTFSAAQSLCAATSTFQVRVNTFAPICPAISQPLDADPGWTIQNSDSLGWAYGVPGGGTGAPTAAHSGTRVYGTNLTGNYGNLADYKLITTPFNLTGLRSTRLNFYRWLNDEAGYDLASVDVSTDGINFTTVWSGFGRDTQWEPYTLDISSLADNRPAVYVRFRLQSDNGTVSSGFYIDDVSICGETASPAPSLAVTSWSMNDGQSAACSDHDAYADGGEVVLLTATIKNVGSATATGATGTLSAADPRIVLVDFRSSLGTLTPGATGIATFRFKVADAAACRALVPLTIDLGANAEQYHATDATSVAVRVQADDGTPVPDSPTETFEAATGWTLTGEWQIAAPQGRGGTANGASGSPDPTAAVSGTKVLGTDLSGLGSFLGSYENNVTTAITATSPVYNCANATNVQLQFKRWLGVESNQFDHATVDVWNGAAWVTIWGNPGVGSPGTELEFAL